MNKKILSKPILLGRIGSCYGIKGWMKIFSFTNKTRDILNYQPWFVQTMGKWKEFKVENWRYHNKKMIVKLIGINDRNIAKLLTNNRIVTDSSQLPILKDNDYYWKDLIGCRVITTKEYDLGKIINIIETGSNDVCIVKAKKEDAFGIKERLIPFLNYQIIKKVDLIIRKIKVDWDPSF